MRRVKRSRGPEVFFTPLGDCSPRRMDEFLELGDVPDEPNTEYYCL